MTLPPTTDLIWLSFILFWVYVFAYLIFKAGRYKGQEDLLTAQRAQGDKLWHQGYSSGYAEGIKLGKLQGHHEGLKEGLSKGRVEGYEDGRRYEAVTHHNQTELEKLLEKETAKAAKE